MFNPTAYENSRPDGISVLEIVGETGPELPEPRRFVPLRRTELRGEIDGPLAALRLRQLYRFNSAECDKVLEAVYRFPLPGDAAVIGVRVQFGDVQIKAELRERNKAESEYREAKKEGRQAALLTRESPDVFTLQVAGVRPDQDIVVETSYVQLARAEGPGWSLRIPLTTSPRYVRGDEAGSRHAEGQPLLLLRDPGHRFALDLTLPANAEVKSPTHSLVQSQENGRVRLKLEGDEVLPDRDCVLNWRPAQQADRPTFQALVHDDRATDQVYFLGMLAPPARKSGPAISREVILLVDHSGSMEGPKWEAADWAVKRFLGELTERDTFALGLFHNDTKWFAKTLHQADRKRVASAVEFLEEHKDSGGTELGVALEQALGKPRSAGEAARHILLITDAEVSDAGRILRLADAEATGNPRRRIDVLCIDAAPNSFLARELAERGGGVVKFLTSAPEEEDIATALDEVLADWTQPVATGLRLEVNRDDIEAAGHAVLPSGKSKAVDLGDLPAGRSLWVAGRVPHGDGKELTFRALTSADREVGGCRVDLSGADNARPALKALFGARRIQGLEFLTTAGYADEEFNEQLTRLGYDPEQMLNDRPTKKSKVYAENARDDAAEQLRRLLVRESLQYGLACSETAFIAVRSAAGKPVEGTVLVANALTAGWSNRFVGGAASGGSVMCSMLRAPSASVDSMFMDYDVSPRAASSPPPARKRKMRTVKSIVSMAKRAFVGPKAAKSNGATLFAAVPAFDKGEALLFDSTQGDDSTQLPDATTFVRLMVEFPKATPDPDSTSVNLAVLLFVDDMASPRARVRVVDLLRQNGVRPLNLVRHAGERIRIVLVDPDGAWAGSAPRMKLSLNWA